MECESVKPTTIKVKTSRRTLQYTWYSQLSIVLDGLEANTANRKNLQISCHGTPSRSKPWDCSLTWLLTLHRWGTVSIHSSWHSSMSSISLESPAVVGV